MPRRRKEPELSFGCRTDVGCVREHNEDSLYAQSPLFAVADGMGGHAAGEVASEIAIECLADNASRDADAADLAHTVEMANQAVIRGAAEGKGRQGMGTTMTAAVVENEKLVIAQVGDSRAYLLHQGNIQQLTRDHSLMAEMIEQGQITPAEARVHPNRSLITRALGSDVNMAADQYEIAVHAGDRLLLCSDGLTSMLTDDRIEDTLLRVDDPQECADKLVDDAIAAGGLDNITVVVVDIAGAAARRRKKTRRKSRRAAFIVILLLLALAAAAIFGGYYLVKHSAYITQEDGYVTIYKGVTGSVLGISLNEQVEKTDIKVSDLKETTREHFNDGVIKVESLDAAYRVCDNYREEAQTNKSKTSSTANSSTNTNASANSNSGINSNTTTNTTTTNTTQ